jgi:hypothetical protein
MEVLWKVTFPSAGHNGKPIKLFVQSTNADQAMRKAISVLPGADTNLTSTMGMKIKRLVDRDQILVVE